MNNVFNKSQIKFFCGQNIEALEQSVNEFMRSTTKIYNVKHIISPSQDYADFHYIMVSYE